MNSEQLNAARLARWSQNGEARLTLEAAREWLDEIGFCAYLPPSAGAPPFASFVEAVVGRPARVPSAGERGRAVEILARLIASSAAVPLKFSATSSAQPDFIVSSDALAYVYALRGNRDPKSAPPTAGNDKVTPLALHCWQAIQQQGSLDQPGLQQILGQDITQPAILRALQDLWSGMYAFPVIVSNSSPAKWDLLSRRFPQQVAAGANMGHAEAQSAMVSLYLHAAVSAPEDEVLTALAPFTSQSKLREVLRGLGSMRQLDIVDIGGRAHVCLQGGLLPETVARLSDAQLPAPEIELETATSDSNADKSSAARVAGPDNPQGVRVDPPLHVNASAAEGKFSPKKFTPKKFVPRKTEFRRAAANAGPNFRGRDDRHEFQSAQSDRQAPRKPRDNDFRRGDAKPWQQRRSFSAGTPPERRERNGPSRQGAGPKQGGGWSTPRFPKRDGAQPRKFQSRPPKLGEDRPWRSQREETARGEHGNRPSKPWQKKKFGGSGDAKFGDRERVGRFPSRDRKRKDGDARRANQNSGERREFNRSGPFSERKTWKDRSDRPKFKGFARPGIPSRRLEGDSGSLEKREFSQSRSWPNKPRTGREDREGESKGEPRRESKSFESGKPGGKRNAKPFWAKPALGGKRSSASRRTGAPRGKNASPKKGGKRK